MKRVITAKYSRFTDVSTGAQFEPYINQQTGCREGVALVEDDVAEALAKRPDFDIVADEEFLALTMRPTTPHVALAPPDPPGADEKKAEPPPPPPSSSVPKPKEDEKAAVTGADADKKPVEGGKAEV